jgi:hypothetical protein
MGNKGRITTKRLLIPPEKAISDITTHIMDIIKMRPLCFKLGNLAIIAATHTSNTQLNAATYVSAIG